MAVLTLFSLAVMRCFSLVAILILVAATAAGAAKESKARPRPPSLILFSLGIMQRAALLVFLMFIWGCTAPERSPSRNLVLPTIDDFCAHIRYPYRAPVPRQHQMARGAHSLHKGMTEAEVLQIIGPPDYKAGWFYPSGALRGEVWHYVHTWERQIEPDYHGKMITLTLDGRVRSRTLFDFDATDFGVRRHE